jgi:hypothetical protein
VRGFLKVQYTNAGSVSASFAFLLLSARETAVRARAALWRSPLCTRRRAAGTTATWTTFTLR